MADLPGMRALLCALATLLDPDGTCAISLNDGRIAACYEGDHIGFRFLILRG